MRGEGTKEKETSDQKPGASLRSTPDNLACKEFSRARFLHCQSKCQHATEQDYDTPLDEFVHFFPPQATSECHQERSEKCSDVHRKEVERSREDDPKHDRSCDRGTARSEYFAELGREYQKAPVFPQ